MKGLLKPSERLIEAGYIAIRAPDGRPLDRVQQYKIVAADETDPAADRSLEPGERLIMAGTEHTGRKAAEERYAAALEGYARRMADGTPLYVKEAGEGGELTPGEKKACDWITGDFINLYAALRREAGGEGGA